MAQSVTCILLTRNRPIFAQQALWYFLRQDYPARELLVADDGDGTLSQHIPSDERIRYARVPPECRTLGAKRNFAIAQTHSDLIAHWDDDDWMSPDRLSRQIDALNASGADVCGARDVLYYALYEGQAWYYRFPQPERAWVAGNTLLYRRAAWKEHPFQDRDVGEDSAFIAQFDPHCIHALPDNRFLIGIIHPQNTATKRLQPPTWERWSLDEVTRLFGDDRRFYVQLRHGRPQTRSASAVTSDITLCAPFNVNTGYGSMAEYMALAIAREGVRVHIRPIGLNENGLSEEFLALWKTSRSNPSQPVLFSCPLDSAINQFAYTRDLFIHTMWEGNRLPPGWAAHLNRARAVLAPTRFVAATMIASGVTVSVVVVPEGIDPAVYYRVERPEHPGLTTLILAPVDERKNTHVGIAAWKLAFAEDPHARLIIKTSYGYHNYSPDDPRIQYVDQVETTRGQLHWYRQADVLLALGSEGFGLPLVEGMATGLPVIALNSEGQADICEDAPDCVLPVLPVEYRRFVHASFGEGGVRGVPGVQDVADRLRWVADHRDEAREIGQKASAWATAQRNVWERGPRALDVIEAHLTAPRLLRQRRMMWTPSWDTECGISEYTAYLMGAMPSGSVRMQVSKIAPDPVNVKLLHIQQEHSLFQETGLVQTVQRMRAASVPVIITEHAITSTAHAWERDASLLVAHTAAGAAQLRARWTNQRVEHIPHGCPTWFPPRKRQRRKVIGAFGFLETYKGFWALLDVLRSLPDTELVIYSRARTAERAAEWERASRGHSVRHVADFLPVAELARRLALEADVLVYWYDNLPFTGSSGAARIGLATGVPVLTSATSMFSDLTEVTYQPDDLVQGVERLLDDTALCDQLTEGAREYCHAHSWERIAARHLALWQSTESQG